VPSNETTNVVEAPRGEPTLSVKRRRTEQSQQDHRNGSGGITSRRWIDQLCLGYRLLGLWRDCGSGVACNKIV